MSDEESTEEEEASLERIAKERRSRKGESDDSDDDTKPVRRKKKRRTKKELVEEERSAADEALPLETWRQVTDYALDGTTEVLGVTARSENEKSAVATTTRAVVIKRLPAAAYAEEFMCLLVLVPLSLSITFEFLGKRRKEEKGGQSTT